MAALPEIRKHAGHRKRDPPKSPPPDPILRPIIPRFLHLRSRDRERDFGDVDPVRHTGIAIIVEQPEVGRSPQHRLSQLRGIPQLIAQPGQFVLQGFAAVAAPQRSRNHEIVEGVDEPPETALHGLSPIDHSLVCGVAGVHSAADPVGGAVSGGFLAGDTGPIAQVLGERCSECLRRRTGVHHRFPDRGDLGVTETGPGGGRQPRHQSTPPVSVPNGGEQSLKLLAADALAGGRGDRVFQVVCLIDDQVEAIVEAGIGGQQGMVENRHMRLLERPPGAAIEVQGVERFSYRSGPVHDPELPAEEPQGGQPIADRGGPEVGPIPARCLRHPTADDR